ncbi:MAG: FHA domain-containing protein [Proteobacteria bacterium]|nr:FHA domain-containing protein [Pseudomonadota bacterium]
MMGFDLAAILGLFGLTSAFALVALVLAAWMCWRIADKAGLPGWAGAGAILLTLTGIGSLVSLILLWVFAFMRWPRDDVALLAVAGAPAPAPGSAPAGAPAGAAMPPSPAALAPPARALTDRRAWTLAGGGVTLAFDDGRAAYMLTGEGSGSPGELVVPDPSVGRPHARLLTAAGRIGLEDLGTPGGTFIDGARLLPSHGPRDITAVRVIKLGNVELALSRT